MNKFDALQILGLAGTISNADIKAAYKRKAKEFHPDRNPAGVEIMKMINVAYDLIKNEDNINVFENKVMNDYPSTLAVALNAVLGLGLMVEVCGLWIWVSGDTKSHKDILKAAAYLWSPKKSMWYFRPLKARSKKRFAANKSEWSMDQIRQTFGTASPFNKSTRSNYLVEKV